MSTVNFSDSTPAAPTGVVNLKWQSDASGNISAYDPVGTWQTWTPTLSSQGGTMTFSGTSFAVNELIRMGPLVHFSLVFTTTLGGTMEQYVRVSVPVVAVDGTNRREISGWVENPIQNSNVLKCWVQGTVFYLVPGAPGLYVAGTYTFSVSGTYRLS